MQDAKSLGAQLYRVLYVTAAVLFVWNAGLLYQMHKHHNDFVRSLEAEKLLMSNLESTRLSLQICRPLLPVQVWNRDSTEVPNPPRWRRKFV